MVPKSQEMARFNASIPVVADAYPSFIYSHLLSSLLSSFSSILHSPSSLPPSSPSPLPSPLSPLPSPLSPLLPPPSSLLPPPFLYFSMCQYSLTFADTPLWFRQTSRNPRNLRNPRNPRISRNSKLLRYSPSSHCSGKIN